MQEKQQPERQLTPAQAQALGAICARWEVDYDPAHYTPTFDLPQGWVAGWVGGPHHRNPTYAVPDEPAGKPTIFIGCDKDGRISS